jgi:DnaK suppressor protein
MSLSKTDLMRFESLLLQQKTELLKVGETGQEAEEVVELDQTRIGRLSRMDAMQAQAMSVETGRRRRLKIIEIDAALKRVRSGDYGDCYECGDLINPNRLEADPSASFCISCAESLE